jgi:DnaJ-class molecular chaperone
MARDPYEVLGVSKSASADEITKAYRKLARQFHPDRNPGDKEAEAKFKEVQNAYDILNDPAKRSNFDRFGSPEGARGSGFGGFSGFGGNASPEDIQDLLRNFMGGGMGGFGGDFGEGINVEFGPGGPTIGRRTRRTTRQAQPQEVERDITIPFLVAANGGSLDLDIDGKRVSVNVPAGAKEGQALRLRGALQGGANLKLKLHIEPHAWFRREGDDLLLEAPISLAEAVLGAKIDVPTLDGGKATVTVPPGASSGAKLRLKGLGIAGGDLFAVLKVVVPRNIDAKSRELIEEFAKLNPQDPRADLPWSH